MHKWFLVSRVPKVLNILDKVGVTEYIVETDDNGSQPGEPDVWLMTHVALFIIVPSMVKLRSVTLPPRALEAKLKTPYRQPMKKTLLFSIVTLFPRLIKVVPSVLY